MDNKLLRLPPGFRFHPTDEELVVQYLRRKVLSCPLPASIIPEIRLGERNPWDLLGGGEQEMYFFNQREVKFANGRRSNRATGSGYWKATGKDKAVVSSKCNRVVGMKKTLVFHRGKAPRGARTGWVMHEYRLASATQCGVATEKDWVLCRVSKKKKRVINRDLESSEKPTRFVDFMIRPSSPSDSDSSCVTETSVEPSSP